jgi:hypothetical protein
MMYIEATFKRAFAGAKVNFKQVAWAYDEVATAIELFSQTCPGTARAR